MAQHVLSDGKTYYVPFVGASLITILLFLLQLLIVRFLQLKTMFHALTYFPSLLILAIITDVSPDIDRGFSFGAWLWVVPLLIVVWLIGSWIAKAWEVYEPLRFSHGFFSRAVWMNLAQFALMFVLVGMVGNSNEVFHYRMAVERSLVKGDYKKALTIGEKSLATDSSLTMLRIYALAANKQLPERLFEYPLVGGSEAMKPNGTSVKMMLYTDTKLRLLRKSKTDYQLCAYLLDRNLDGFVKAMVKTYGKPTVDKQVGKGEIADGVVVLVTVEIVLISAECFAKSVAIVKHRCHSVEAETIEMEFVEPVFAVREQEVDNLVFAIVEA